MTFTVTYRGKDGSRAEVEIEAANRAECVAACRARGVAPVAIREGRSGRRAASSTVQGQPKERPKRKPFTIHICFFVAIAAIAAIAWWWFGGRGGAAEPEKPSATDKPKAADRPKAHSAKPCDIDPVPAAPVTTPAQATMNARVEAKPRPFNPNERPPDLLPNEPWRSGRKKLHKVQYVARNTNTVHRNATEQALLDIFSCEVGDPPLPLTDLPREDLTNMWNILRSPNPITDKDAEEVKIGKETLEQAKKVLMKYIKEGGTPDEFLSYYHGVLEKAYQRRMIATEEIYKVLEEQNDPEIAREMLKRVNRELHNEGIRPLPIPLSVFQPKEPNQ